MIENQDARDHWKELAEQLGLPPEPEGNAIGPVQAESPRARQAEPAEVEEAADVENRRPVERDEEPSYSRRSKPEEPLESIAFRPIQEDLHAPSQPEGAELEDERSSRQEEEAEGQEEET